MDAGRVNMRICMKLKLLWETWTRMWMGEWMYAHCNDELMQVVWLNDTQWGGEKRKEKRRKRQQQQQQQQQQKRLTNCTTGL